MAPELPCALGRSVRHHRVRLRHLRNRRPLPTMRTSPPRWPCIADVATVSTRAIKPRGVHRAAAPRSASNVAWLTPRLLQLSRARRNRRFLQPKRSFCRTPTRWHHLYPPSREKAQRAAEKGCCASASVPAVARRHSVRRFFGGNDSGSTNFRTNFGMLTRRRANGARGPSPPAPPTQFRRLSRLDSPRLAEALPRFSAG